MKQVILGAAATLALGAIGLTPATAADSVMKTCSTKYQAAKASKTLPAGQSWMQFLAACRGSSKPTAVAAPAAAAPAVPAAAPVAAVKTRRTRATTTATTTAAATPRAPGQKSPAQLAEQDRLRQCGAQWKADKAAGKTAGQTWPKYWSACSKRLKG